MEAIYLKPPTLGVNEPGWYAVQGDNILAGPFNTKAEAEGWIAENTPEPPIPGI